MADERKKTHSVLLAVNSNGKSKKTSIELFNAALWPQNGATEGLFRLRIGGKWHCAPDAYTFYTPPAVGGVVASLLAGGEVNVRPCPEGFENPVRVSVPLEHCDEDTVLTHTGGWTVTPPHLGPDGRWWVWVNTYDGKRLCPCDDVIRR